MSCATLAADPIKNLHQKLFESLCSEERDIKDVKTFLAHMKVMFLQIHCFDIDGLGMGTITQALIVYVLVQVRFHYSHTSTHVVLGYNN